MDKKLILAAAFAFLILAIAGAWGYVQYSANRKLENYLSNKYQRAFYDLASQAQSLEVLLSKTMVANDPYLHNDLLLDIRQQAAFAQANMGQLPLNDALAGRTSKFLSQVGDYAYSLSRQVSYGVEIDGAQWDTLSSLYGQVVTLNGELQGIQENVANNSFYFREMVRQVRNKLQQPPDDLAVTDFQSMDKEMQRFPVLIYDGPFSEHLERENPKYLSDLSEVDEGEAEQAALDFIDRAGDGNTFQAKVVSTGNGRLPAYRVAVSGPDTPPEEAVMLDISRQGGKVVWMFNPRVIGAQALNVDEGRQKALNFLTDRGFGSMRSTYDQRYGDTVTFNFAAMQDGVILYADLIKVTVALDNGEIIGAECTGYLMSHRKRDLPDAVISQKSAREAINGRLEVTGGELALIPAGATSEQLAYEFRGKLGEDTYLIYINADNGREQTIIKLIETPGGTLTM